MTTWILIFIVYGSGQNGWDSGVATGTAIFHSQESCLQATKHFHTSFCVEDKAETK